MEEAYLKELIQRYLEKKSTDEELEAFVYLMKQGKLDQYLEEAMNSDLDLHKQEAQLVPERKVSIFRFRWPIAAAIATVVGLVCYFSLNKQPQPILAKVKEITIRNSTMAVSRKVLPDGSIIWLNPQAVLSYPSQFGKLRKVSMEGEVFFEVAKDHAHPFVISSGNVLTKVWGTSFRIRSVPGEQETKVSVLTGKVSVRTINPVHPSAVAAKINEIQLQPEEEAIYENDGHQLLKKTIPVTSDVMVWRKTNLSFENVPLAEITAQLSQHYHVRIEAEGEKLQKYKLTADFKDKNLADILLLICKSVQTSYSSTKDGIILKTNSQQINHL